MSTLQKGPLQKCCICEKRRQLIPVIAWFSVSEQIKNAISFIYNYNSEYSTVTKFTLLYKYVTGLGERHKITSGSIDTSRNRGHDRGTGWCCVNTECLLSNRTQHTKIMQLRRPINRLTDFPRLHSCHYFLCYGKGRYSWNLSREEAICP